VLKVDLHLHTWEDPLDPISYDARTLVDRAARQGFDVLAITLHERQFVDPRLSAYARDRGVLLLPGIERSIEGRHVLLINFPAALTESVNTFEDLRRLRARTAGVVVAPHPFFPARTCVRAKLEQHAPLFDAVEWSYFWTRALNFNARAAAWAREHGKAIVGNSDLHDLRQFGRTYSLVDAPADTDAICQAIREGKVSHVTSPVPYLELASVFGAMALATRTVPRPVPAGG
jgi:predicted metal-dependent phosphoesterase TrpH